jgi:hypothetical protein
MEMRLLERVRRVLIRRRLEADVVGRRWVPTSRSDAHQLIP